MSKYAIVEFELDGSVSFVPSSWIYDENKKCRWPKEKNKLDLYRQELFAPKNDWHIYTIKKIFSYASTLQEARRKEKKSQTQSNVSSDDEAPVKRRRVEHCYGKLSGKMSSVNKTQATQPCHSKLRNENNKKCDGDKIDKLVRNDSNANLIVDKSSHSNSKITENNKKGTFKKATLNEARKNDERAQTNSSSSSDNETLINKRRIDIEHSSQKLSGKKSAKCNDDTIDNLSNDSNSNSKSAENNNREKVLLSKIESLQKIIETFMEGTRTALLDLSVDVKCIKKKVFSETTMTHVNHTSNSSFPLQCVDSFKEFEEKIKIKKFAEKMLADLRHFLKSVNTNDMLVYYKKILKIMFSNDVIASFAWSKISDNCVVFSTTNSFRFIQESALNICSDPDVSSEINRISSLKKAFFKSKDSSRKSLKRQEKKKNFVVDIGVDNEDDDDNDDENNDN